LHRSVENCHRLIIHFIEASDLEGVVFTLELMKAWKLEVPDDSLAKDVLKAFEKHGTSKQVVVCFHEMSKHYKLVRAENLTVLLNRAAEMQDENELVSAFDEFMSSHFTVPLSIFETVLEFYGKDNRIEAMKVVWKEVKRRKIVPSPLMYHQMIRVYAVTGEPRLMLALYMEMFERKITPLKSTFKVMILAYAELDDMVHMRALYNDFRTHMRIAAEISVYNEMLASLLRQQQMRFAQELMMDMQTLQVQPDAQTAQVLQAQPSVLIPFDEFQSVFASLRRDLLPRPLQDRSQSQRASKT